MVPAQRIVTVIRARGLAIVAMWFLTCNLRRYRWWCLLFNPGSQQEIGSTFKLGEFGVKAHKDTGPPSWLSGEESACQCRRHGFDLWVGRISWRRKWQSTPVFLPEKSHGQRSLPGCCSWGHKESDNWAQHSNGEIPESRAGKSGAKVWFPRASSSRTFRCPPVVL